MRRKMVILLAFICIILAGFVIGVRMKADRVGPEITFGEKDIAYREGMDEEKLLKDMKAGKVPDSETVQFSNDRDTHFSIRLETPPTPSACRCGSPHQ